MVQEYFKQAANQYSRMSALLLLHESMLGGGCSALKINLLNGRNNGGKRQKTTGLLLSCVAQQKKLLRFWRGSR